PAGRRSALALAYAAERRLADERPGPRQRRALRPADRADDPLAIEEQVLDPQINQRGGPISNVVKGRSGGRQLLSRHADHPCVHPSTCTTQINSPRNARSNTRS